MAAFALVDVFEDCHSFFWLNATVEDSSDAALHKLPVDYCVCCGSSLHQSCCDLISRQLSAD